MSQHPVADDEWSSTDTQRLAQQVDLASREWRRSVVAQIEPMAATLEKVRDLGRDTALSQASKEQLAVLSAKVDVLANSVAWLRWLTVSVLVVGVLEKLAEVKKLI